MRAVHVVDGVLIGDTSAAANRLPRCTACAPAEQPRNGSKPRELPEPKTRTNPNKSEQDSPQFPVRSYRSASDPPQILPPPGSPILC